MPLFKVWKIHEIAALCDIADMNSILALAWSPWMKRGATPPYNPIVRQSYSPTILPKHHTLMRIHSLTMNDQLVDTACSTIALEGTRALAL